jgi:hypothetical protein
MTVGEQISVRCDDEAGARAFAASLAGTLDSNVDDRRAHAFDRADDCGRIGIEQSGIVDRPLAPGRRGGGGLIERQMERRANITVEWRHGR